MQRVAAVVSCLGFWVLAVDIALATPFATAVQAALVLLACVEKLCSIMNMIAIERDWVSHPPVPPHRERGLQLTKPQVVVIAGDSEWGLQGVPLSLSALILLRRLSPHAPAR